MSNTSSNKVNGVEPEARRGSRERLPNITMDRTAVAGERLVQLRRSRGGHAATVSRKYSELSQLIKDEEQLSETGDKLNEMYRAFREFENVHQEYVQLAEEMEPATLKDNNDYFRDLESTLFEARQMFENYRDGPTEDQLPKDNKGDVPQKGCVDDMLPQDSKGNVLQKGCIDDILPRDSASQQGSNITKGSTASARVRASARKAFLQAKVQFLHKQEQMEQDQLQKELTKRATVLKLEAEMKQEKQVADMSLRRLELEAELHAATAEEETLSKFVDGVASERPTKCATQVHLTNHTLELDRGHQDLSHGVAACHSSILASTPEKGNVSQSHIVSKQPIPYDGAKGVLNPHAPEWSGGTMQIQRQLLDVLSLPKTSLMTYDGDPLSYWSFMNSFDCCVGDYMVSDGAKLNRLLEYCTGKAAKVIKHCSLMPPAQGYVKARQLLKERFGNEYRISDAWIQKVTEGPPIKPSSKDGIQDLADDVRGCIEVLGAMGTLHESRSRMLKTINRLPMYIQGRWRKFAVDGLERNGHYPDIEQLAVFLEKVAREINDPIFGITEEPYHTSKPKTKPPARSKGFSFKVDAVESTTKSGRSQTDDTSSDKPKFKCYLCDGGHCMRNCSQFQSMSAEGRLDAIKERRLCFNCFNRKHTARDCTRQSECGVQGCSRKHSRFLHGALVTTERNKDSNKGGIEPRSTRGESKAEAQSLACENTMKGTPKVALPIVPVWVRGIGQETYIRTSALLDPGSNRTFCSLELARLLGLKGQETTLSLETLDAERNTDVSEMSLEVMGTTGKRKTRAVIQLPRVFALQKFPSMKNSMVAAADMREWKHLQDLQAPQRGETGVNLLIGQDVPKALMPLEVRHGTDDGPYAMRTFLGWTINGPLSSILDEEKVSCNYVQTMNESDVRLEDQVERFWKLDATETLSSPLLAGMSVEDTEVVEIWEKSATLVEGHYSLDIPFKSGAHLPDNKPMAEKRLGGLGRRLLSKPDLHEKYKAEMSNLLEKGYAEHVEHDDLEASPGRRWYIPHHAVLNPNKPDKTRIVFDCAAERHGVSLNKVVLKGPDLTNKLLGVLLRFRENKVAITADIESMFHQVRVSPHHRDVLRFLWWKDGDLSEEVQVLRMTAHLFGGVWSPSCAAYALKRTALDHADSWPQDVVDAVLNHFYVDDFLMSFKDEDSAIRMQSEVSHLLLEGGFHLTKWMSNSRLVLNAVPRQERGKQVKTMDLDLGGSLPLERALGVHWDTDADVLGLRTKLKDTAGTRRGLLAMMSSVYDPLGMVGPFILQAKKIFQAECRLDKGWDAPLEAVNEHRWKNWLEGLPELQSFSIERCLVPDHFVEASRVELHVFCDASQEAYGAVAYLRLKNTDGDVHCSFLLGKTRLAPMKAVTIPRLELLACVVAVQMDVALRRELHMKIDQSVFWSDSMIAIQYIQSRTLRFKTFVANRVAVIHENSSPEQWRHVSTDKNPADHASRGLNAREMVACSHWSKGPDFLWQDEATWNVSPCPKPDPLIEDPEVKQEVTSCAAAEVEPCIIEDLLKRHSSWLKLRKSVAWILRFIDWVKRHRPREIMTRQLTTLEIQEAEKQILKYLQWKYFCKEITSLRAGQCISKKSHIYPLEPFLSSDGLLRVGGRLRAAPIVDTARCPAILPRDDYVTMLIVRHVHECQSRHSGRQHVLALIRQAYWVPKCLSLLRRVLANCVTCRRFKSQPCGQRMADLPLDRLVPDRAPFTNVGVDCFGPFYVKRGRSLEKRYGCIFTCLTIRAIHIEKLSSMDADSFINAFVRFAARRGNPEIMRSDNGTNFVAANKEFQQEMRKWQDSPRFRDTLLVRQTEWKFNPPSASHMGGVWERQIRTVRKVMNSILRNQSLDDERLDTVFCEVESIVNGRPLTTVSQDPKDPEVITPNHLLLLRSGPPPIAAATHETDVYGRRWRHVQFLSEVFWKRWTKEYLSTIQLRQKWIKPQRNLMEGDIVLVVDEMTPRKMWPLGRVTGLNVASDGLVRSVEVKLQSGVLVRPVHKLCLLEAVSCSEEV